MWRAIEWITALAAPLRGIRVVQGAAGWKAGPTVTRTRPAVEAAAVRAGYGPCRRRDHNKRDQSSRSRETLQPSPALGARETGSHESVA